MNKKLLIFTVSSFVVGAAIGGTIGFFLGKKKSADNSNEVEENIDISSEDEADTKEEHAEDIKTYSDLIDDLEYRSNNDEEEFTEEDNEELDSHRHAEELRIYKENRSNTVEEITEDMYYSDSDETGDLILGYEPEDLYYFENQNVLVSDLGELKYPIEHFVGDILDESDKDKYYIRNHVEEMNYRVMKRDSSERVEDYFPDIEY